MLNRLQSLFNRLAGVPDTMMASCDHRQRSYAALDKPACWRRRSPPRELVV